MAGEVTTAERAGAGMTPVVPSVKRVTPGERRQFETWMRRFWRGIPLHYDASIDEYKEAAAQVGYEAWAHFCNGRNAK